MFHTRKTKTVNSKQHKMQLRVDVRENDLIKQIQELRASIPVFKDIEVIVETLPLGDIIITNAQTKEDKVIIERKSVADLAASIKDGRYEEQSYRLNGLDHHNHNIIYLIEGDVNRVNRFKDTRMEKMTLYSAIFSLNYFKGFSVIRTFGLEETAIFVCNTVNKLKREEGNKQAYYIFKKPSPLLLPVSANEKEKEKEKTDTMVGITDNLTKGSNEVVEGEGNEGMNNEEDEVDTSTSTSKNYVSVIKKVKKDNVTTENIGEIMLCQIPGISSVTALAIMEKYKNLPNLVTSMKIDPNCLNNVTYTTAKNQTRKISKACIVNIVKYLFI